MEMALYRRVACSQRVAGLVSLALNGGPKLGIEFKGGMEMTVKFASAPNVEKIRTALGSVLSSPPEVQTFQDGSNGSGDRNGKAVAAISWKQRIARR